jgi:cyclophilin family peptidyl-prolyl cis-trans isomerase
MAFAKIRLSQSPGAPTSMYRTVSSFLARILAPLLLLVCAQAMPEDTPAPTTPTAAPIAEPALVRVYTNKGSFVIELETTRAPLTVANFLEYVRAGHYNGTIFHRVINNFVAQGGGFDEKYVERPTRPGIPNESGNGLSNRRGTVGIARAAAPHSANAQFYVNIADNAALDPQSSRWGYAVFGKVIEGMSVLDDIGAVATGAAGPFESDVPLKPVVIEKIEEMK